MSKRRKAGDWVYVKRGSGFVLDNGGRNFEIQEEKEESRYGAMPCLENCGDDDCREWLTLVSKDGVMLCHVPECRMNDEAYLLKEGEEISLLNNFLLSRRLNNEQ